MLQTGFDPFSKSASLEAGIRETARTAGVESDSITGTLLSLHAELSADPNSVFPSPPTYRRVLSGEVSGPAVPEVRSTHSFFDVVKARASRRDFGTSPVPRSSLLSLLGWTFGKRADTIAYDWRNAPLRYCSSAGGLASIDGYCIALNVDELDDGSYYFDIEQGLVKQFGGLMSQRLANSLPGMSWLERAGAVVVLVANPSRVDHKYQAMGAKLSMLDAGVAAGHLELVATALELRACVLGSLPADILSELLCLCNDQVPLASLAVGSRS